MCSCYSGSHEESVDLNVCLANTHNPLWKRAAFRPEDFDCTHTLQRKSPELNCETRQETREVSPKNDEFYCLEMS